jgi:hypothetical protein
VKTFFLLDNNSCALDSPILQIRRAKTNPLVVGKITVSNASLGVQHEFKILWILFGWFAIVFSLSVLRSSVIWIGYTGKLYNSVRQKGNLESLCLAPAYRHFPLPDRASISPMQNGTKKLHVQCWCKNAIRYGAQVTLQPSKKGTLAIGNKR